MGIAPFDAGEGNGQAAEAETTSTPASQERKIRAAMAWLQEAMAGQQKPAAEMIAQAEAAGIARSTLTIARQRLHIRSERRGGVWHWIPSRQRKKQPVIV